MAKQSLTEKQKAFCREYLADNNATQAAIRAGYAPESADVEGSRLLDIPMIAEQVQRLQDERATRTDITNDWVLYRFKEVADRCMQAEPVMMYDAEKGWIETGEYKFDSSGAIKALENIARHLGFYAKDKEKAEDRKKAKRRINVSINVPPFKDAPNGG